MVNSQKQILTTNIAFTQLALKIEKLDNINISWNKLYNTYKKFGGDGFYAVWVCPFQEPAILKF